MGVENAIQQAGDKGLTVFEYFWEAYPLYTFLILFGFFILIILALLPRKTIHVYEEPYGHSAQRQREVVAHHSAPQQPVVVRHVYEQTSEPTGYEEPKPVNRRRFPDLNNLDPVDNWGFLDGGKE